MGTESLRVIGCIFAENGPLEGGIESSFWGTDGVLRVISCVILTYTRTFSNREPIPFFESTCPELYAQQSWEWSDAYSWRNDLWKVNLSGFVRSRLSPYGDLKWIFGPDPFIFEGGPPPFSESTCPQVWAQKVWEWLDVYSRRMGP